MESVFSGCSSLAPLDLSSFDTLKVSSMAYMFKDCSKLVSLDLSSFKTSSVEKMYSTFEGCSSLTSLDLSSFSTSKVTSMYSMFSGCSSLASLDLSSFDTLKVRNMGRMFSGCGSLASLDLSSFDTLLVWNMACMFSGCGSLVSLDFSFFDTSSVTSMSGMFEGCRSLTSLDLSPLDTSNVENMEFMFEGCCSLTSLDLSPLDTSKGTWTSTENMLSYCWSLTSITLGSKFSGSMSDCGLYTPSGNGYSGKWVSSFYGRAYSVDEIPRNVWDTYTPEQRVPVYRMYNPITSEHLFTTSESEYDSLTAHDWRQEGVSWSAPTKSGKGVYRVYNPGLGAIGRMSHHYTSDYAEAADLVANHGWRWDNGGSPIFCSAVDFWGYPLEDASEVYRLYNDGLSAHHFTLDFDEDISLIEDHGWNGEGVAFYAYE